MPIMCVSSGVGERRVKMKVSVVSLVLLATALTGCPSKQKEVKERPKLQKLAQCVHLMNWVGGQDSWWRGLKHPDGTYEVCDDEPFYKGPRDPIVCVVPDAQTEAVMVKGQTEEFPHHLDVSTYSCLDYMHGGIQGKCNVYNCKEIAEKAPITKGCQIYTRRHFGTCEMMWGYDGQQDK